MEQKLCAGCRREFTKASAITAQSHCRSSAAAREKAKIHRPTTTPDSWSLRNLQSKSEVALALADYSVSEDAAGMPESPAPRKTWQRILSLFVTLTTLTVAASLGVLYFLVSRGT